LTGIVYDDIFLEHGEPWHPENSRRLEAIMGRLKVQWLCAGRPRTLLLLQKRPRTAPPHGNGIAHLRIHLHF